MKIEIIYYRLWSRFKQSDLMDRAKGGTITAAELRAINIESNNIFFVKKLETIILKGNKYCENLLRGLIADYVKRCSRDNGDSPYLLEYYIDWIDNTKLILNGKYPFIDKWCEEYRERIINYFENEKKSMTVQTQQGEPGNRENQSMSTKKPKVEPTFSDIIQYTDKEALLKRLHSLIDVCSKGTIIAAILSKAVLDKYLIRLPNKEEVSKEFKLPCTWEAVRKNLIDNDKLKNDKRYIAAQKVVLSE